MFKYASSKPSKKKIKEKYTGESEWAERVSMRCFHLTTQSQLQISAAGRRGGGGGSRIGREKKDR
jgi:hypothetical protein